MQQIVSIGLILIVLGVLAVLLGLFMQAGGNGGKNDSSVRGGMVLFIGPIPVILGSDRDSALSVAIVALVLMALAYFLFRR